MSLATPESLLTASASSLVPGDRAKVVDEMRMKKVEKDKERLVMRREIDWPHNLPQADAVVYSALASKYPPYVLNRDRVYIFVISVKRIYVSDPAQ